MEQSTIGENYLADWTSDTFIYVINEGRGSVVSWGTKLQAGRSWIQLPMLLDF
jgi:hypothetical protein